MEKTANTKTLKELKASYGNDFLGIEDLKGIELYEVMLDLASNFIRMVTWKKEKDLDYIKSTYQEVMAKVIIDIGKNGYKEALATIKNNDLHKAYNLKYIYNYYGLDYQKAKEQLKAQKNQLL